MELVYIWFKDFRNVLRKIDINFSSEFTIKFMELDGVLQIRKNDMHINNFFRVNNIQESIINNITGIIGENGIGKTSILDYIKNNIPVGEGGLKEYETIILIRHNKEFTLYHHKNIDVVKIILNDMPLSVNTKIFGDKKVLKRNEISEFRNTSFIFFSNIFDGKREFKEGYYQSNLLDISTNYLLYKDYFDYRNANYLESTRSIDTLETIRGVNPVVVHRKYEFKRQLFFTLSNFFVHNNFDKISNVKLPDTILIKLQEINIRSIFSSEKKNTIEDSFYEYLKNYELYFLKKAKERVEIGTEYLKIILAKSIFFNFVNNASPLNYLFKLAKIEKIKEYTSDNIFDVLKNIFVDLKDVVYNDKIGDHLTVTELIQKNVEFIDFMEIFLKEKSLVIFPKTIVFNKSKLDIQSLKDLIEKYLSVIPSLDFLDFEWNDFSSGQKAYLNICSRFYELTNKKVNNFSVLKENVIILIDEGELYFHPQWQKHFINYVLTLFYFLFKKGKNKNATIQIIVTSNSPFIVSDLPKDNIVFLKRNTENNFTFNCELEEQPQTFAANIHNLFSNSFFMQTGLIGDFAKERIDYIISLINNYDINNLSNLQKDEIKKTIDIIGEPIIKNKLHQMLNDKLNSDIIKIHERINKLEDKVFKNNPDSK